MDTYIFYQLMLGLNAFTFLLSLHGVIKSARDNSGWVFFFAPLGGVAVSSGFYYAICMFKNHTP